MDTQFDIMPILMLGLNHKVSSIEARERLAFNPERVPAALQELIDTGVEGIKEAVLLSTCNRTECYVCTDDKARSESHLLDFMARKAGLPVERLRAMVYILEGEKATEHLMQVACGLDSLVLGENEILGQVRGALELAQVAGATGPILAALFRNAIHAGKRARAETEISRGNISVASVVVELAEQSFGRLDNRTALLIGAGKISSITARALTRAGLHCIMVANRTFERAEKLAKSLNGMAVRFDHLDQVLLQADIVICSTGAPHIILHADVIEKAQRERCNRPLLIADLAVPRDVDPKVASIPGVKLANIDDLDGIIKTSHMLTAPVYQEVMHIVGEELESFTQWCLSRRCVAVIQALYQKAEHICEAEIQQTLHRFGPLTSHQERLIQAMGKAITGKMLHDPAARLHDLSSEDDISAYLTLVQDLYGIQ